MLGCPEHRTNLNYLNINTHFKFLGVIHLFVGRANTIFINGQHLLRSSTNHNHAPEATRFVDVCIALSNLKAQSRNTNDQPCQIIQSSIANTSSTVNPYMPTRDVLWQRIKRAKRENMPLQPKTLRDLTIPDTLRTTIDGEQFLIKDSLVDNERLLLFCTKNNIYRLSLANYLIMDGTFWTVPTIYRQLYTIHAPVGGDNYKILPLSVFRITLPTSRIQMSRRNDQTPPAIVRCIVIGRQLSSVVVSCRLRSLSVAVARTE